MMDGKDYNEIAGGGRTVDQETVERRADVSWSF